MENETTQLSKKRVSCNQKGNVDGNIAIDSPLKKKAVINSIHVFIQGDNWVTSAGTSSHPSKLQCNIKNNGQFIHNNNNNNNKIGSGTVFKSNWIPPHSLPQQQTKDQDQDQNQKQQQSSDDSSTIMSSLFGDDFSREEPAIMSSLFGDDFSREEPAIMSSPLGGDSSTNVTTTEIENVSITPEVVSTTESVTETNSEDTSECCLPSSKQKQRKRLRPFIPIAPNKTATTIHPPETKRQKILHNDDDVDDVDVDASKKQLVCVNNASFHNTQQQHRRDSYYSHMADEENYYTDNAVAIIPPQRPEETQLTVRRQQQLAVCSRVDAARRDEMELNLYSSHFDALLRVPGSVHIDYTNTDILSSMCGMSEVSKMLWTTIVKPQVDKAGVASTIGSIGSLHFCITGRSGSGKRTAVRTVCSMAGVEVWTINPSSYVYGDINKAIHQACLRRPCVVLIDDFASLRRMENFAIEVSQQIDACSSIKSTWDGVWIGILLWDDEELDHLPWVQTLCGQRIARVKPMSGREGAIMLTERFLLERNVEISPCLTNEQFDILSDAAEGRTPGELKDFASSIMYRILDRTEITPNGLTETTPSQTEVRKYGRAAKTKETEKVRKWRLSWEDDVVPLYQRMSATESEFGIEKFYIPKKRKEQLLLFQQ